MKQSREDQEQSSPVIVFGMHRSGTTLLAELLQGLGLFIGAWLNANKESRFFLGRNQMLLQRAGGEWDHPQAARSLLTDPQLFATAVTRMRAMVSSLQFIEFTGFKKAFKWRANIPPVSWGWKDPRTVFTLPIWAEVFPNAKLLYVRRNGVDVANSLFRRAKTRRTVDPKRGLLAPWTMKRRIVNLVSPIERTSEGLSARCLSMEGCYSLWEEYTIEAEAAYDQWEGCKMVLRYEDLLDSPGDHLAAICSFCELLPTQERQENLAASIHSGRAYAFQKRDELGQFYLQVKERELMKKLGYHEIA